MYYRSVRLFIDMNFVFNNLKNEIEYYRYNQLNNAAMLIV